MLPQLISTRLAGIESLRVLLICLVVAHHAAQPYGPTGGAWPVAPDGSSPWLGPFFSGNAAFFMGLFFLLSGLFVSSAVDRKGPVRFLGQRALRLGVPLLIVGGPVFGFIDYAGSGSEAPFIAYLFDTYLAGGRIEIAHMWFVAHLLVYSAVYALWRTSAIVVLRVALRPPPSNRAILGLLLAIGIGGNRRARLLSPGRVDQGHSVPADRTGSSAAIRRHVRGRHPGRAATAGCGSFPWPRACSGCGSGWRPWSCFTPGFPPSNSAG